MTTTTTIKQIKQDIQKHHSPTLQMILKFLLVLDKNNQKKVFKRKVVDYMRKRCVEKPTSIVRVMLHGRGAADKNADGKKSPNILEKRNKDVHGTELTSEMGVKKDEIDFTEVFNQNKEHRNKIGDGEKNNMGIEIKNKMGDGIRNKFGEQEKKIIDEIDKNKLEKEFKEDLKFSEEKPGKIKLEDEKEKYYKLEDEKGREKQFNDDDSKLERDTTYYNTNLKDTKRIIIFCNKNNNSDKILLDSDRIVRDNDDMKNHIKDNILLDSDTNVKDNDINKCINDFIKDSNPDKITITKEIKPDILQNIQPMIINTNHYKDINLKLEKNKEQDSFCKKKFEEEEKSYQNGKDENLSEDEKLLIDFYKAKNYKASKSNDSENEKVFYQLQFQTILHKNRINNYISSNCDGKKQNFSAINPLFNPAVNPNFDPTIDPLIDPAIDNFLLNTPIPQVLLNAPPNISLIFLHNAVLFTKIGNEKSLKSAKVIRNAVFLFFWNIPDAIKFYRGDFIEEINFVGFSTYLFEKYQATETEKVDLNLHDFPFSERKIERVARVCHYVNMGGLSITQDMSVDRSDAFMQLTERIVYFSKIAKFFSATELKKIEDLFASGDMNVIFENAKELCVGSTTNVFMQNVLRTMNSVQLYELIEVLGEDIGPISATKYGAYVVQTILSLANTSLLRNSLMKNLNPFSSLLLSHPLGNYSIQTIGSFDIEFLRNGLLCDLKNIVKTHIGIRVFKKNIEIFENFADDLIDAVRDCDRSAKCVVFEIIEKFCRSDSKISIAFNNFRKEEE